jgi:small-conductance mechanosensitive channel
MKKIFAALSFIVLFSAVNVSAETAPVPTVETNATQEMADRARLEQERKRVVSSYMEQLQQTNDELRKIDSLWQKSYSSYLTYLEVKADLKLLKEKIAQLSKYGNTISEKDELAGLLAKEKILTEQITLLKGRGESPFTTLLKPQELGERPVVTNPFEIFSGISYKKHVTDLYNNYKASEEELRKIVVLLRKKVGIYENLLAVDKKIDHRQSYLDTNYQLEKFETALGTVSVTLDVYEKRIEEVHQAINEEIQDQLYKLLNIGTIIVVLFVILVLVKMIIKKYIIDNERYYMANKILNFTNFALILIILIFNYIENVNYLVTVLGFASAGIAIAMKDWFMSMLGWLVIVLGGSIHVGDRIRVDMDGMKYVGDVLDISLLRMTILEDVTYTTYLDNRRAGRIIFIPNNYIFTQMIANYSHSSLKTVWDGIDIAITFDSNHKKAMHIAKEVARKYSKGYTDITRKQLNKLRDRYSLKNTNVEPRVFSLAEPHGIVISTWYLTNAYATMTLRSVISTDIIEAYLEEDDIQIAYPTQRLYLNDQKKRTMPEGEGEESV